MCFGVSVPGLVGLLRLVAQRAVVAEVQMPRLHVVPHVALHGAGVLALQAAEPAPLAQGQDPGHDQGLVLLHRALQLPCHRKYITECTK